MRNIFLGPVLTMTSTVPLARLYLMALDSKLTMTCFNRIGSAITRNGTGETWEVDFDSLDLCLLGNHVLTIDQHLSQRQRLQGQGKFARLDQGQIQDFR
jgi:hypothetical protein